jgi:WD40 repeat protein
MRKNVLVAVVAASVAAALLAFRPGEIPLAASGPKLEATLVKKWGNGGSPSRQAEFSRDGRLLATSTAAGDVTVMATSDWHITGNLKVPGGATSLSFSPNGAGLFTAGYDGIVRSWRLSDGRLTKEYRGARGTVWTIDIRPDGREVAAAGEDKIIHLWSLDSDTTGTLNGHERNIWNVRYSPDGKVLASGSFDTSVRIWRGAGAQTQTLSGHRQAVVGLDVSPNGELLATGGDDSTLRLWRMGDGKALRVVEAGNHVYNVEFSSDSKWIATAGRARGGPGTLWHKLTGLGGSATPVHIWRVSDGAAVAALPHSEDVSYASFSPDQRYLVTSAEDGVRLWRLDLR